MYRSFIVRNFRCFHSLAMQDLGRFNLIAGKNNVGKTALLEAFFLHCGAWNPELALRLNAFRGIEMVKIEFGGWRETPWDTLFKDFDTSRSLELEGDDEFTGHRTLSLKLIRDPSELAQLRISVLHSNGSALGSSEAAQVLELEYHQDKQVGKYYMIFDPKGPRVEPIPPPPPFPAFFLGARMRIPGKEEAEHFGNLDSRGEQEVFLRVLRIIEPRLQRVFVRVIAGEPVLYGDIGLTRSIPLPLMGEGMARLSSLVLHIGNAPNGVVLVDEVENGIHYSVLPKVWQALAEAARHFNTQVFATTHSLECIAAAHEAFSQGKLYDFRLHRLERINDEIRVFIYDQELLAAALEAGLEVR
uniref:ATPase n=3 Tax=Candidatus Bipolaricaulota TaxID=67810 RepID=H5SFI0_9BACT|nr:ATPase [uncultured Acetothermia bacterium]